MALWEGLWECHLENLWKPLKPSLSETLPLRDPLKGRFPSQRLSVLLPLIVLPLNLSPIAVEEYCRSLFHDAHCLKTICLNQMWYNDVWLGIWRFTEQKPPPNHIKELMNQYMMYHCGRNDYSINSQKYYHCNQLHYSYLINSSEIQDCNCNCNCSPN